MPGLHGSLQAGAMIEGQQHVVDRRAVGHDRVSLADWEQQAAVFPRNRAALNSPGGEIEPCGAERQGIFRRRRPGLQGEVFHFKAIKSRVRFSPNSGDRLLKWLNSLYRPALPEGIRAGYRPPLSRQSIGASPSGKAVDFDSTMRRFESSRPSQPVTQLEIVGPRIR